MQRRLCEDAVVDELQQVTCRLIMREALSGWSELVILDLGYVVLLRLIRHILEFVL